MVRAWTGAGGVCPACGSVAKRRAGVTARRGRLLEDCLKGILYTSAQTHHSVQKAAMLAGFPPKNVRAMSADAKFRIRVDLLREEIARDRAELEEKLQTYEREKSQRPASGGDAHDARKPGARGGNGLDRLGLKG